MTPTQFLDISNQGSAHRPSRSDLAAVQVNPGGLWEFSGGEALLLQGDG